MVVVFSVTLGIDKTKIQKLKNIRLQMNHTCFLFLWSPELIRWALALPLPWFFDLAAREQNTIQLLGRINVTLLYVLSFLPNTFKWVTSELVL